jgi:hypothetical protein
MYLFGFDDDTPAGNFFLEILEDDEQHRYDE